MDESNEEIMEKQGTFNVVCDWMLKLWQRRVTSEVWSYWRSTWDRSIEMDYSLFCACKDVVHRVYAASWWSWDLGS